MMSLSLVAWRAVIAPCDPDIRCRDRMCVMAASAQRPSPFPAPTVEQVCRVLGDAVTGSEIPNLIAPLRNGPEPSEAEGMTKWKRLFNAVAIAQNRLQDGRPLVRLVNE